MTPTPPNRSDSQSNDSPGRPQDSDRENDRVDDRSAVAKGLDVAGRVTTMSITMALPAGLGYLIDQRLGTDPIFIVIGALFGMASGFWLLLKLVRTLNVNE